MKPLRILSWNVFLMHPTSSKSPKKRVEAMVEELLKHEYDVLLLQKVFYEPAKKNAGFRIEASLPSSLRPVQSQKVFGDWND